MSQETVKCPRSGSERVYKVSARCPARIRDKATHDSREQF
jgi:hypothetical protein